MSGAVAAHASYNGSGTQGLAVTNKISDSAAGDVVSVFWNETDTTRQLLYGSSTLEVPTSGSGKNASWGGSQIFTVNKKRVPMRSALLYLCLLYTSPSPRDRQKSRMPSSA